MGNCNSTPQTKAKKKCSRSRRVTSEKEKHSRHNGVRVTSSSSRRKSESSAQSVSHNLKVNPPSNEKEQHSEQHSTPSDPHPSSRRKGKQEPIPLEEWERISSWIRENSIPTPSLLSVEPTDFSSYQMSTITNSATLQVSITSGGSSVSIVKGSNVELTTSSPTPAVCNESSTRAFFSFALGPTASEEQTSPAGEEEEEKEPSRVGEDTRTCLNPTVTSSAHEEKRKLPSSHGEKKERVNVNPLMSPSSSTSPFDAEKPLAGLQSLTSPASSSALPQTKSCSSSRGSSRAKQRKNSDQEMTSENPLSRPTFGGTLEAPPVSGLSQGPVEEETVIVTTAAANTAPVAILSAEAEAETSGTLSEMVFSFTDSIGSDVSRW